MACVCVRLRQRQKEKRGSDHDSAEATERRERQAITGDGRLKKTGDDRDLCVHGIGICISACRLPWPSLLSQALLGFCPFPPPRGSNADTPPDPDLAKLPRWGTSQPHTKNSQRCLSFPKTMPTHGPPSPILQKSVKRQRQDSYDGTSSRNDFSSPERQAGDANLGGGVIAGNGSSSGRSEAGASAAYPGIPVAAGNGHGTSPGLGSGPGASAIDVATAGAAAANTNNTTNTADPDGVAPAGKPGQSSNFRNVSACNRCRLRKNRCDQKLPSCASCNKVGVSCVGYDPITKKEIPRR